MICVCFKSCCSLVFGSAVSRYRAGLDMLSTSVYRQDLILTPARTSHAYWEPCPRRRHRRRRRRQWMNRRARQSVVMSGDGPSSTDQCRSARDKVESAAQGLAEDFAQVDSIAKVNVKRVIEAFRDARIGPHHFAGSSGYGRDDIGREALDKLYAIVMGTEDACVRSHFQSGTHTIACALYGLLRPGDELLSVVGPPYETLQEVIGLRRPSYIMDNASAGSLSDWGVGYREAPLDSSTLGVNYERLGDYITAKTRVALVQRSCGYTIRKSLSIEDIRRAAELVKSKNENIAVIVDNCYGEMTEVAEPGELECVDLIMGSLIKNPGGTLATCGGYICGKREFVQAAASRLSAPGVGIQAGATLGFERRLMFQGLFMSPTIVGEAVKGAKLLAAVMQNEGFDVHPSPQSPRSDIIQAIQLGSKQRMISFCEALQAYSPISSYVRPTPAATDGYESPVIFADGTFVEGCTVELSADGPLRDPYTLFCQGGTHLTHWKIVLENILCHLEQA